MPEAWGLEASEPQARAQSLVFLSRDSLRVFSSLCQIFSEEDNYSQSRELLMQVRAVCLPSPPYPPTPASAPVPSSPLPPPQSPPPLLPPPQPLPPHLHALSPGSEAAVSLRATLQEGPKVWLQGRGECSAGRGQLTC